MSISRRDFLAGSAAIPLALGVAQKSWAAIETENAKLTTVSDGNLRLPVDFIFGNLPTEKTSEILSAYSLPTDNLAPECNLTLFQSEDRNVLFDVGSGHDFMPSAGKLLDSLDDMDLSVDDVTDVVITHAHPDHIWGLLDDFDDLMFPDATYHMGRAEWDYWWNPSTVDTIGEARAAFAVGAKRRMEAIEDMVNFFDDGDQIIPNVVALSTPGHTPGHMGFEIDLGSDKALVIGDAIGNHHLSFLHPDWASGADEDPVKGIQSRLMLFDRIVRENLKIVGFHLPDGGIGHVEKRGAGFQFIPSEA